MKTTIQNNFFRTLMLTSTTYLALVASASVFAQTPTFPGPKPIPSQAEKLDRLDATVVMPNGMSYFFHNKKYSLFDIARNKKAQTTRLDRAATFQKKLPANLDAALIHPINRKVYIFKGNQYYRYNFFKTEVDKTRTIGVDGWKGLNGSFDAALSHPTQNAAYFSRETNIKSIVFPRKKLSKKG